jgi:hypothetical protein
LLNVFLRTGVTIDAGNIVPADSFGASTVTVISQNAALTTSWQRFVYTGYIDPTATQIGIRFTNEPVGTAGANDWYEVTGVQLEAGPVATPFRRHAPSIQGELATCQRYFEAATTPAGRVGSISPDNGDFNTARYVTFSVPKRINPSVTVTVGNYDNGGATNGTVGEIRPIGFYHSQPVGIDVYRYNTIIINYTANAEL